MRFSFLLAITLLLLHSAGLNGHTGCTEPLDDKTHYNYSFLLNNGDRIELSTGFRIYHKDSGNISRLELTHGRYIHFQIKGNTDQKLKIKLSYSKDGFDEKHFHHFRTIETDNSIEDSHAFLILPDFIAEGNTFIKWEIENADMIQSGNKTGPQLKDTEYLTYELRSFSEFRGLIDGHSGTMNIVIDSKETELFLEEVNLLAKNHKIITYDGINKQEVILSDIPRTYSGVNLKTGGQVRLTVNDNFVYGFIETEHETFYIEPAITHNRSASPNDMLIYSDRDIVTDRHVTCGADHVPENKEASFYNKNLETANTEYCAVVEYGIATDYSIYTKHGSSIINVVNRNMANLNNVQANYLNWFSKNLVFEIVEQFIVTAQDGNPWTASTDPYELLPSFRTWGNNNGFSSAFDVATLWSNRDFDGSTVGLAYLSAVCSFNRYNVNQEYTSNATRLRVMLAHELGHNFGANHDDSGAPFIMAPQVGTSSSWSELSINAINNSLSFRTCINECEPTEPHPVCGSKFYDSGGADIPYSNNEDIITTVCPDFPGQEAVSVLFTFFRTQAGQDILTCYDGVDTTGEILWEHSGESPPPVNPVLSTHTSGCLTFRFVSNASTTDMGWIAQVSCTDTGPCISPKNVTAFTIDHESALLSWSQENTVDLWEIEYGTHGFVPTGMANITGVTENPYTLEQLQPETQYDYYVRAVCDETGSIWRGPATFTTKSEGPDNDLCSNAFHIAAYWHEGCPEYKTWGTLRKANTEINPPYCAVESGDTISIIDVWYQFFIEGTSEVNIRFSDFELTDLGFAMYQSCDSQTPIACFSNITDKNYHVSNLPVNDRVLMRVFSTSPAAVNQDFSVCVSMLPPPKNDECAEAFNIIPEYSCSIITGTTSGATWSFWPIECNEKVSESANDVWYSFEADGIHHYTIDVKMNADAVIGLYSNSCRNPELLDCADNQVQTGDETINTAVLNPGTYFIRIYGFSRPGDFELCLTKVLPYTISSGLPDNCMDVETTIFSDTDNWTNIHDSNGDIIASLNLGENNFDIQLTTSLHISSVTPYYNNFIPCMERIITLRSATVDAFEYPVRLRLYYTDNELNKLMKRISGTRNISNINIAQTYGNCGLLRWHDGITTTRRKTAEFSNGYYIEVETHSLSTFIAHGGNTQNPVYAHENEGLDHFRREENTDHGTKSRIFPNPGHRSISFIPGNCSGCQFEILDINGIIQLRGLLNDENLIDVSELNSGCYIIRVNKNDAIEYLRFVKL